jgi:hypothetical protein
MKRSVAIRSRARILTCLTGSAMLALALSGCGAAATFTSAVPPPDATAEAWYRSDAPAVRSAIVRAMRDAMITVDPASGDAGTVVGTRQQVPYVGEGGVEPAAGPLPAYRLRVTTARRATDTHVLATVSAVCRTCDGKTPYEWEYPGDLLKDVLEGAREILGEKRVRVSYPPRHRPVRWRPPRRP